MTTEVTSKPKVEHPDVVREQPRRDVVPAAFAEETPDGFELRIELPGVSESDLDLTIEDRTLAVQAQNSCDPPAGFRTVREECPAVRYRGVYEIPELVDTSSIKAALKDGMLKVVLPKREEVKPRKIAITSG